jgi:hypothetical protein
MPRRPTGCFYNGALDDKAKAEQLNSIANAAAAARCLGP